MLLLVVLAGDCLVLVELDVTKHYPDWLWVGLENLGYFQTVIMAEFPSYCLHCKSLSHSKLECCSLNTISPSKPLVGNESVLPTIVELLNEKVDLDPLKEAIDVRHGHLGSYADGGSLGLPIPMVTSVVSLEIVLVFEVVHSPVLMVAPYEEGEANEENLTQVVDLVMGVASPSSILCRCFLPV
ncbi:hypothetical protein IEQ34_020864 [Dendrobium chrysotoxum]|uniref:Uncharacterized protein n=1 Tax=Dendrobium chrysotoxum TaxID=161865 RepID=A0AAV7G385_DENCH|nr:hypothetical protein IEQ34_020864 [Dendrobium chrysotoxum]